MGIDDPSLNFTLMTEEDYEPIENKAVENLISMVNQAQFRSLTLILGLEKAVSRVREIRNPE